VAALVGAAAAGQVRAGAFVMATGEAGSSYPPLAAALLLAALAALLWWVVRRRSPLPMAYGPVWNCGFIDPPAHLPFGDPLTQPTAGGIAQPLRRMLGEPLLQARESVDMPRPGETRAGHYAAGFRDPSGPLLLAPAAAIRDRITTQVEKLRDFTIRRCLSLSFGTLVGLLALLAWLEGG
jgi:hypothetical protein